MLLGLKLQNPPTRRLTNPLRAVQIPMRHHLQILHAPKIRQAARLQKILPLRLPTLPRIPPKIQSALKLHERLQSHEAVPRRTHPQSQRLHKENQRGWGDDPADREDRQSV